MKLYIIRHGETDANVNGVLQGWTDEPLNKNGEMLAHLTGQGMGKVHFDAVYSSPLQRASKTASILMEETGNDCPVYYDDRLRELNMGDLEGKCYRTLKGKLELAKYRKFFKDPSKVDRLPGGEGVKEVMARTQECLKEIASMDYESVLVSTHGCALRCMLNFLYEDKENFWHDQVPLNCVVNIVEAKDGELKLVGDDVIYYDEKYCVDHYADAGSEE